MQAIAILLISVLAAIFYGVVHDQITARICVEYFTIGHARLIDSDSPTVLNGTELRPIFDEKAVERPGIVGLVEYEKTSPIPAGSFDETSGEAATPST